MCIKVNTREHCFESQFTWYLSPQGKHKTMPKWGQIGPISPLYSTQGSLSGSVISFSEALNSNVQCMNTQDTLPQIPLPKIIIIENWTKWNSLHVWCRDRQYTQWTALYYLSISVFETLRWLFFLPCKKFFDAHHISLIYIIFRIKLCWR